MRISVLAALMAATMLVPAAAVAQDDQPQRGERARGEGNPQRQGRPAGQRPEGAGERPQREYARPQPQAQVQPQVQARMPAPPAAQPPAAAQFERGDRGRFQGRPEQGRPDQGGRQDFRGGRGDDRGLQQQGQGQFQQSYRPGGQVGGDDRRGAEAYRRDVGGRDVGGRDGGRREDGRRDDYRATGNRGYDQRGYAGGYNGGANGAWSRDWRRDNRYNYSAYRNQNRNAFHLPRYYAPYGWNYGYRRFSIGFTLSSFLYGQDYWIEDADYYRLPPAYGPYRWVRYYNDALLVDLRTGYVVDTVYDIFW